MESTNLLTSNDIVRIAANADYDPTHMIDALSQCVEQAMFVFEVLRLVAESDGFGAIWWRCDGEFSPITIFVNANDVFWWATADVEPITPEDLPALRQALHDVAAVTTIERSWGFLLWAARKRGMRPQQPAYPEQSELRALFDACGPERDPSDEG